MAMADGQDETIEFLSRATSYGAEKAVVERIETHCSVIFLVEDRVYKLKRAVAFASLDYSTLGKREAACRAEVALNRRTAPELYLGVRAIRRGDDGRLTFEGNGPPVDWIVVMRRFDQKDLLDRLADAHELSLPLMKQLGNEIAAFHAAAEITPRFGGSAAIGAAIEGWWRGWADVSACLGGAGKAYNAAALAALAETAELLNRRREQGKVRRCHGDLRLANICLLEGRPTLFDCVEFSDEISCIDVLYDLAFPLMDLHHRGLAECGNALFNCYADLTGELEGLRALPLFLSLRAATRAQMLMSSIPRHPPAESRHLLALARSHFIFAQDLLHHRPPRLIAIGGLRGSGKSTVAQALAAAIAPAPGARVIRSDVVRKRLMKVSPEARLPPTAYDIEVTRKVYAALCHEAEAILAAEVTVILDATFLQAEDRQRIAEVARAAGVSFVGLWLQMAEEARAKHLPDGARTGSSEELMTDQRPPHWHIIDASRGSTAALAAARLLTDSFRA